MAIRHFTLTLGAVAANLGTLAGFARSDANDIPYRELQFQVSGADAFLGEASVSTTDYGLLIELTATPVTVAGGYDSGPLRLSDFYGVGASSVLHVLGVPF